jgi:hypothetical protein
MNKQTFEERLRKITDDAETFVENLFLGKRRVVKLCNKSDDCLFEMPDFPLFDKRGCFIGWCNIIEIRKVKHTYTDWRTKKSITGYLIAVTGVEEEWGGTEKVFLKELEPISIIRLASYFQ